MGDAEPAERDGAPRGGGGQRLRQLALRHQVSAAVIVAVMIPIQCADYM